MTTFDENIFISSNSSIECDEVIALICDGKKGLDCTKENADYSKAKNLVITIGKLTAEFTPEEYLYVDTNHKN